MKGKSTAPGPQHPKGIVQRWAASTPSCNGKNQSGIPVSNGSVTRPLQQSNYQTIPKTVGTPEAVIANPKLRSYICTIVGVFNNAINDTELIVAEKQQALDKANSKDKSLLFIRK